tara:strand:- start:2965 stop:3177 length:213 start_codon:yes stop_codon:yes gene_type:complete
MLVLRRGFQVVVLLLPLGLPHLLGRTECQTEVSKIGSGEVLIGITAGVNAHVSEMTVRIRVSRSRSSEWL